MTMNSTHIALMVIGFVMWVSAHYHTDIGLTSTVLAAIGSYATLREVQRVRQNATGEPIRESQQILEDSLTE